MNSGKFQKLRTRPQLIIISIGVIGSLAMSFLFSEWISKLALLFMAVNGMYFFWKEWTKPLP